MSHERPEEPITDGVQPPLYAGTLPSFADLRAQDELYGYGGGFGPQRLPGTSWEEGNMFDSAVLFMPNCDMENAVFTDKVWQFGHPDRLKVFEKPEDAVLVEIFYSDAVRRLQAVEQLTCPPEYTTIPNTGAFSRFEHIWGSVLFARQICEKFEITGREAVVYQLRTLVSDIAHTFGSHLGDWAFQGVGGPENLHDLELYKYLEAVGINDILRKHGYEPDEIIFPIIVDFIEAPKPDLCDDRVDYGLREMNRWNDSVRNQAFSVNDFTLTPERMLAMTDQRRARIFAEGYLLLGQEHWSEPTHRFMLDMIMLRTKLFYGEGRAPKSWVFESLPKLGLIALQDIHPRDLMYVTDPAQEQAYAMPNLGGHTLQAIMSGIARYRRQYVWPARKHRINQYMAQFIDQKSYAAIQQSGEFTRLESETYNSYRDEYPPTFPAGFAILDTEEAEATRSDMCIDFPQPPFPTRQIDPLVQTGSDFKRLSELDPSFATRLDEHERMLQRAKVARLAIADPKTYRMVRSIVDNVEAMWQQRLANTRRMDAEELRSLVSVSAREIFGGYPFMTFYEM